MIASRHISVLLLVTFAVIFYRDIYPLATYTRSPMDLSEGWALWAKVTILSLTSIAIPLFTPRRYIPVDPNVGYLTIRWQLALIVIDLL